MPSKHGVGGSNPFVGAIFFMHFLKNIIVKLIYMDNKYYQEQELVISELLQEEKFDEASKIINEELSMPYIPRKFEEFLLEKLKLIPFSNRSNSYTLSLSRIIDLLLKLDSSKDDVSDLIKYISKFNLDNEKEELEYYFSKSTNTRNRATLFELLIQMKADIECDFGKTKESTSILDLPQYKEDLIKIQNKLEKYPTFSEITIELLNEIYLTTHLGQKLEGGYSDMAIYTMGRILQQDDIIELIDDLKEVEEKLKSFKSLETF